MTRFLKITEGVNVAPLLAELDAHPELWGQFGWRKELTGGPHGGMTDIWVRFAEKEEDFHRPHFAVWYPAYRKLPALKSLIFDAMAKVQASHLGGVLITRIPPGQRVDTHVDRGWHPEFYNCKLYFVLKTNPKCIFRVGDEHMAMEVGDLWRINNLIEHDVINDGETERMTLIVCTRQDA